MTKHHFTITHAFGPNFDIMLTCEGCADPEPVTSDYSFRRQSGDVVFDPPDSGDTEATLAQLLSFLAQHDAFGLTRCDHADHAGSKESVKIGESTISLWGQAE
jgi:hypothetical protein